MDGRPKTDLLDIVGRATARLLFFTFLASLRHRTHYPKRATRRGRALMSGEAFTDMNFFMDHRCSYISCHTCGLIFGEFKMSTCVAKESIISRTAVVLLTFSSSMRFTIRMASKAMVNSFGA